MASKLHFHLGENAVAEVKRYDPPGPAFTTIAFTDGGGNEVTIFGELDQLRRLTSQVSAELFTLACELEDAAVTA